MLKAEFEHVSYQEAPQGSILGVILFQKTEKVHSLSYSHNLQSHYFMSFH